MKRFIALTALVWFACFSTQARAVSSDLSFEATLPPFKVDAGQEFSFKVQFHWTGNEDRFKFIVPDVPTTNLEIVRVAQASSRALSAQTRSFEFVFLAPSARIPALIRDFDFSCVDTETQELKRFHVKGSSIVVKKSFKTAIFTPAVILTSLVSLIGMVGFLFYVFRRKVRSDEPRNLSHQTVTVSDIDKIVHTSDAVELKLKELSTLYRQYLLNKWKSSDKHFFLNAVGDTMERRDKTIIVQLFNQLDELEFSGKAITENELQILAKSLKQLINRH